METYMPNDDESQTDPPAPSADDALNTKINAALTGHLKRFAEKQLPVLLESALKPIHEKLAAPAPVADEGEGKSKGKDKISPEMQALQAQLEEFKSKFAKETEARVAAEKKSRDDKAQNELRAGLQPHVKGDLLDILTDHLFHRKAVVEFDDESGGLVFKSKKTDMWGAEEEVRMPLKAGIEQFLKSSEAKPFLPAPGSSSAQPMKKPAAVSNGSGQSASADPTKMTEREKIARAAELEAQFTNRQR